jgi:membrane protein
VFVYSNALGLRVLASFVPLTLLGLALLGITGREDLWREDLGPAIEERVRAPVFAGIDHTVERIFAESAWALLAFAAALALWHVSRGIRIVMKALNTIHDTRETRSPRRLLVTDLALACALIGLLTAAFLLVVALPRLGTGVASTILHIVAWVGAALLLAIVIGLLVRYAPAERPEVRWASAGSLLVVAVWVVTTVAFGWWAGSVADYESAVGVLLAFLVLTTYVLASTTIFLVGAQVDELARKGGRR